MNGTGGGRADRWRPGMLAAVVAGLALLAAACGGSGSAPAALTAYQKALAYAQCMRAHGVPGFPDPQANGNFLIGTTPNDHAGPGSAQFAAASKACQHLLPPSKPLTPAQQRQFTTQALRFVACMRSHGVPDMPDPVVNSGGAGFRIPHGLNPHSPVFGDAQQACRKLMPGNPP